jgi:hypothetical protein
MNARDLWKGQLFWKNITISEIFLFAHLYFLMFSFVFEIEYCYVVQDDLTSCSAKADFKYMTLMPHASKCLITSMHIHVWHKWDFCYYSQYKNLDCVVQKRIEKKSSPWDQRFQDTLAIDSEEDHRCETFPRSSSVSAYLKA